MDRAAPLIYRPRFFTLAEFLRLPRWGILHEPTPEELANLSDLIVRFDFARACVGVPLNITSGIRPVVPLDRLEREVMPNVDAQTWDEIVEHGGDYNAFIGGAEGSAHMTGCAGDAVPAGMSVDEAMVRLIPHLPLLGLRAENNGESRGRKWLHLDTRPVAPGGSRIFEP